MKRFYTDRDVADLHLAGVTEIEVDDDVVLTDLARERAQTLGMRVIRKKEGAAAPPPPVPPPKPTASPQQPSAAPPAPPPPASAPPAAAPSPAPAAAPPVDDVAKVKAAVVARLGTEKYNSLLDTIIPQVMSKLGK